MSAVENLLKRKGPATVETSDIIKDGEPLTVDSRRARSLVSRGLAEYAEDAEAASEAAEDSTEPSPQEAPANSEQAERDDPHADRALTALKKDELVEVATHYGLDTDGTMTVLQDRINAHLSAASESGANAGDEPLSGSDSDGD